MLKISSIQRGPQHVNAAAFESLRMYCSMLLVSLASELGEAVLQVARFMSACPALLLTAAAASPDAQQHASHLRSNQRSLIHQLGITQPNRVIVCPACSMS